MNVREIGRLPSGLPPDDDHPYRTGAWAPTFVEYDSDDNDVIDLADVDKAVTQGTRHTRIDFRDDDFGDFGGGLGHAHLDAE